MRHRDYCGVCGETYSEDNLVTCRYCGREFCYRCGDSGEAECRRCKETGRAGAPPSDRNTGDDNG